MSKILNFLSKFFFMEGLFLYKNMVYVPHLVMIDYLVSFSDCGTESMKKNAIMNAKVESKNLSFGPKKCPICTFEDLKGVKV